MNNLQIIEHKNQRILLTSQLAEGYETSIDTLTKNFNRNIDRYQEGKHYFALESEEKREFLNLGQFDLGLKNAKTIYLWTEKGAMLHAKSLNTDKAWEMYETLVDTYFEAKQAKPMTQIEIIAQMAQANVLLERKMTAIEAKADRNSERLESALDVFTSPISHTWKEETNRKINLICMQNGFNYQTFKGDLYSELEAVARCNITARQTRLRERMKKAGATSKERIAISKIDVIERDDKLKLIFDGIVKKYQAKYIA